MEYRKTYATAKDAGIPKTGTLAIDLSTRKLVTMVNLCTKPMDLTECEQPRQGETDGQQHKGDEELAALSDSGEKWAPRSGLPDLV